MLQRFSFNPSGSGLPPVDKIEKSAMRMRIFFPVLSLVFCLSTVIPATAQQDIIRLNNASFEDTPRTGVDQGRPHRGWYDCGDPKHSVPDVQPSSSKDPMKWHFGVSTPAFDGRTYLGMVVRADDTYEGLAQRLRSPIKAGTCYDFRVHLARSEIYLSPYDLNSLMELKVNPKTKKNHGGAVKLRIWGSNGYCGKQELLGESPLVEHTEWREYVFRFEPKQTHRYILIEAFYRTPVLFPYNGNILVDNASPIKVVPCDEDIQYKPTVDITKPGESPYAVSRNYYNVIAQVDHVSGKKDIRVVVNGKATSKYRYDKKSKQLKVRVLLQRGKNRVEIAASNKVGQASDRTILDLKKEEEIIANVPDNTPSNPTAIGPVSKEDDPPTKQPFTAQYIDDLKQGNIEKGQVIRLNRLYFDVDSATIKQASFPILDEVYEFMQSQPSVVVEVGGHTNNRCDTWFCDQLSEARAKSVAQYLERKGIPSGRLKYKGYGKRNPVATNNTPTGRKNNQRVEIKILSLSG
ncbi:MAG: OmpA family protein [Bacteroidota bacterium]